MKLRWIEMLVTLVVFNAAPVLAQGIQTPAVTLELAGEWQERPEWVTDVKLAEKWAFYEKTNATLLHVRRTRLPWKPQELRNVVEQFRKIEPKLTERPGFARFLASAFFLFPPDYVREVARVFDPGPIIVGQAARILAYKSAERGMTGRSNAPRMWNLKKIKGDAEWFYISQLTPRYVTKKSNGGLATEEEYAPTRLTRGERHSIDGGEVLVFELETEKPAVDKAIKRFQMPPALRKKRLRYGWVLYAPEGFAVSSQVIHIVFATPASSGVTCETLLVSLVRSRTE